MNVGIVGAGTMGTGIAQVALMAGCEVHLYDENEDSQINARDLILARLNRLEEKGKIGEGTAKRYFGNLYLIDHLHDLTGAGFLIEAIIENREAKMQVIKVLDQRAGGDSIIATNTSSLSISELSKACRNQERFLGIHFFNPASLMKLVEIVPGFKTSDFIVGKSQEILDSWGKTTVIAKDYPGFIVNRIARPFYNEALRILEEGIADIYTIDGAFLQEGFKMGPFQLMDLIGNDINYQVNETVWQATGFESRYRPSQLQKNMMITNQLGRKTGKGFYDYAGDKSDSPARDNSELGRRVFKRVLLMLINEAADLLYRGVASKEHIELAMTLGVNYPKGLLTWADEIGVDECVASIDKLFEHYHEERYRCSPLLRDLANQQKGFFT